MATLYKCNRLLRHKHEAESGRTSSVGNDILGFDSSGAVVNKPDHGNLDWVRVCEKSSKVITFIDLAGHEKYLKTTVFGMTGHAPDFGMLMVGANAGIVGMTKEHLVRMTEDVASKMRHGLPRVWVLHQHLDNAKLLPKAETDSDREY